MAARRRETDCDTALATPGAVAPPIDEVLATMAKALGHPARVAIVRLLAAQAACVTGEVVAQVGLAQSTVSEHLRILREAGLVQATADGARTQYCLNRSGLAQLQAGVAAF